MKINLIYSNGENIVVIANNLNEAVCTYNGYFGPDDELVSATKIGEDLYGRVKL